MVLLLDNCRIHVTLGLVSAHSPKAGNHQSRIAFLEKALDDFPSNSHVRGFSSHILTPEMEIAMAKLSIGTLVPRMSSKNRIENFASKRGDFT